MSNDRWLRLSGGEDAASLKSLIDAAAVKLYPATSTSEEERAYLTGLILGIASRGVDALLELEALTARRTGE